MEVQSAWLDWYMSCQKHEKLSSPLTNYRKVSSSALTSLVKLLNFTIFKLFADLPLLILLWYVAPNFVNSFQSFQYFWASDRNEIHQWKVLWIELSMPPKLCHPFSIFHIYSRADQDAVSNPRLLYQSIGSVSDNNCVLSFQLPLYSTIFHWLPFHNF